MEDIVSNPQLSGKLARWTRWVRSTLPFIGWILRALAIRGLCAYREAREAIAGLSAALDSPHPKIAAKASDSLSALENQNAIDRLCDFAISDPSGNAAKLCVKQGYRPHDEERAALFLFVTRQLDDYFEEDDGFEMLRREYERADPAVQGYVMEVVRSGDRRCLGFFGARKKLSECSDQEIRVALESSLKHQDWPRLWKAFTEMPLRLSIPLINPLGSSGWRPSNERERSLFGEVQRLASEDASFALSPSDSDAKPKSTSSVFNVWLQKGASPEYANKSTAELLASLDKVPPPEAVTLVAALAKKPDLDDQAREAIENHKHWLVRLAGHATGAVRLNLSRDGLQDPVHWVRELAGASDVLKLWPVKATPDDLEALDKVPEESWTGKLGTARRLLRALMSHKIDTGVWEEVVVEAGELAGEWEEVGGLAPA